MTIRIAYITLSRRGGMIHYIRQLITHLPANIDSILITRNIPDSIPKTTCYRFDLNFRDLYSGYRRIIRIIRSFDPDIIHITSGHILLVPLMRRFRCKPIIVTLHDVIPHTGENTWLHRFIIGSQIRYATRIFVHGSLQKKELIYAGVPEEKITIIPHGDYSFFRDQGNREIPEEKSVLFFGRIVEYKGLNNLLTALIDLQQEYPVKLIIAGEGDLEPYRKNLYRIDHRLLEVHNRYIGDQEVASFFQRSEFIVLPYTDGSQTGIVPIAYAFHKPVVATDIGSFSEIIEDGKTGLLVPPNDPEALKNAMVRLISDQTFRRQLGENGYSKMQKDMSWDTVLSRTIPVYNQTLEKTRDIHG